MRDDITHNGQRMFVIFGHMINHAGPTAMQVATAKILGTDLFTRRGLDQRWASKEDRTLIAHNDAFVGHCRDISATRSTAAHHAGNLRNALGAHIGLIEEDAPEMVAVGKDFILMRKVRAATVHKVDTRQAVGLGNFLRAQMLFDGHRVISATLYRRIVANNHALTARNATDSGD